MKSAEEGKQNRKSAKKIIGFSLISLSLICFLLGIFPSFLGIGNFFLGVFGIVYFPLFLLAGLVGVAFVMGLKYNFDRKFTAFSLLSLFSLLCLLQTIFSSNLLLEKFTTFGDFGKYLSACFTMQYSVTVGGVILGIIVYFIRALIGLGATYVLFAVLATLFVGLFIDYLIVRNNKNAKYKKSTNNYNVKPRNFTDDKEDLNKSIFEQTKYIEELDEKLNSVSSTKLVEESDSQKENVQFINEDNNQSYDFDSQIGVNKIRENDEDYTAAYKTLFGDISDVDKEDEIKEMENVGPKSAKEVLFGDGPAVPNIFDRDPSERDAWRRQYSSNRLIPENESQNQKNIEEESQDDGVFNSDDGLIKTSWGTYRPTANIRNSENRPLNNMDENSSVDQAQNRNVFDNGQQTIFSEERINDSLERNKTRLNVSRERNQNLNTISRVNQQEQTSEINEVQENTEFGSRLTRAERRLRGSDLLADASSLGIQFKEVDSEQEENPNENIFAVREEQPAEIKKVEAKQEKREQASFVSQLNRKYNAPPTTLLSLIKEEKEDHSAEYKQKSLILEKTLDTFKIPAKVINVVRGPKVTRYELSMPLGIPVSRVLSYERDMTMALAAKNGIRIEAPIPGKNAFGVEVANDTSTTVGLRELIESPNFKNFKGDLPVAVGKNISGEIIVKSLAKMVHLLVAGSTGSGKSVFLHSLIMSLMYRHSPDELRFIMIDPKRVEFAMYNRMPHLMLPEVVSDTTKAINALNWAVKEMERRYQLLVDNGCQKIDQYNNLEKVKKGQEAKLPYLVIVVDELAELMGVAKKDVEGKIQRITQLGRASGIHMVVATQRPSVDIVTGVIKNNMPTRIAFSLSSAVDSRTILDEVGAEKLLGQGDMLYSGQDSNQKIRLQAAFVPDDEIRATIAYIKDNNISVYDEEIQKEIYAEPEQEEEDNGGKVTGGTSERQMDELMPQALKLVMKNGKASISMIQRRFQVGYARAARIIDQMETHGFIDGGLGNKPRDIKITVQEYNELFGNFDSDN